jgi:hypothetical protein
MSALKYPYRDYKFTLVQAHHREVVRVDFRVSALMVDHIGDDLDELGRFMWHVTQQMEAQMVSFTGHLDKHRLWFSAPSEAEVYLRERKRKRKRKPWSEVWFLDGPSAGRTMAVGVTRTVRIPSGLNTAEYRVFRVGEQSVAVLERESTFNGGDDRVDPYDLQRFGRMDASGWELVSSGPNQSVDDQIHG